MTIPAKNLTYVLEDRLFIVDRSDLKAYDSDGYPRRGFIEIVGNHRTVDFEYNHERNRANEFFDGEMEYWITYDVTPHVHLLIVND